MLYLQRALYVRRRQAHLHHEAREIAGLPLGRSRREESVTYRRPKDAEERAATRRSSRVVTLRFAAGAGSISTVPPAFSTSIASSLAAATQLRIGRERLAQGFGPERLWRLRRPEVIAALGLGDRRPPRGNSRPAAAARARA